MTQNQYTAFVVMGFGKKTDFETGRVLDLDKAYKNMIKPAIEEAGLHCIRADEIIHSGLIDVPMYKQLLQADVVVADLSTSNKNALYELGVRHALRPHTTVVIAEDGITTFPFDINHVAIRKYHHLGEDIGYDEVMRFRKLLTTTVMAILQKMPRAHDSPVYAFLNGLTPPCFPTEMQLTASVTLTSVVADSPPGLTYNRLMEQVNEAKRQGNFVEGQRLLAECLTRMKAEAPEKTCDPYIIQQLALHTYKSKVPSEEAALYEAKQTLATLSPDTSNDTETLGLWGAVHKRLWEVNKDRAHLNDAIRAYERGFYLRNDHYNGINFAYLLNVRATTHSDHRSGKGVYNSEILGCRDQSGSLCRFRDKTITGDNSWRRR